MILALFTGCATLQAADEAPAAPATLKQAEAAQSVYAPQTGYTYFMSNGDLMFRENATGAVVNMTDALIMAVNLHNMAVSSIPKEPVKAEQVKK